MKLTVKVVPGASRTEITGWLGDALKVRVRAPPERGKANADAKEIPFFNVNCGKLRDGVKPFGVIEG